MTVVLRCTGTELGVRLDEWNAVLELEPGIYAYIHSMCSACARRVHGVCTACARHVRGASHGASLTFEPGGAAEGVLSEGDVLVSIDGVSCAGAILAQARHGACISTWRLHSNRMVAEWRRALHRGAMPMQDLVGR